MMKTPHPHLPSNVNRLVEIERETNSFNEKVALFITNLLGNMWTAYFFILLAITGFPSTNITPPAFVQWLSQTFIQLVALSVLSLGQSIQNRHTELRAEESFKMEMKITHDTNLQIELLNQLQKDIQTFLANNTK